MSDRTTFACPTCFDTETVDHGGHEIPCSDCQSITVRITGLQHGLGMEGRWISTAVDATRSTVTFEAPTVADILASVATYRADKVREAVLAGRKGRNSVSSGAIAIEKRVRAAVASEES